MFAEALDGLVELTHLVARGHYRHGVGNADLIVGLDGAEQVHVLPGNR